jgi:hypothetical protein
MYRLDRVREAAHRRNSYGNRSTRRSACNLAHASQIAPGALLGAMLDYCRKRANFVHTHLHVSFAWFITSIDSAMHYKAAPVVCLCHKAFTLQPCPCAQSIGRALLEAMLRDLEEKGQLCPHALESEFYLLCRFDRVREAVHSRTSYGNRSTRCSACNLAHASQIAAGALLGAMLRLLHSEGQLCPHALACEFRLLYHFNRLGEAVQSCTSHPITSQGVKFAAMPIRAERW